MPYPLRILAALLMAVLVTPVVIAESPREARLGPALAKPAALAFDKTPWNNVLRALRQSLGAPIFVDRKALETAQLRPDTPVTFRLSGVSLHTALGLLLRQLQLDWTANGEVLVITSPDRLWLWNDLAVYDVSDLTATKSDGGDASAAHDVLLETIAQDIAPDTWAQADGKAALEIYQVPGAAALVLGQTWTIDRQIHDLLAQLRRARREPLPQARRGTSKPVPLAAFSPQAHSDATRSAGEEKILAALARRISLDLGDATLPQAVRALHQILDVDLRIAPEVSLEEGRAAAGPFEIRLADVPAETILKLLAIQCGLTWTVRDDVLWLLPPEKEGNRLLVKVYDVRDLAGPLTNPAKTEERLDQLSGVIQAAIAEDTWTDVGGAGSISSFASEEKALLTVTHSWQTHRQIESLLAGLRAARRADVGRPDPDCAALRKALAGKVTLDFDAQRLDDVVAGLEGNLAVKIFLDRRAIGREEGAPEKRVTLHKAGITAQSALDVLLAPLDLAWTVHDDLIVITTPKQAENELIVRAYDAGDLVDRKSGSSDAKAAEDMASLVDKITESVAPKSWGDSTSQGAITPFRAQGITALVIVQTWRNHEAIAELLKAEAKH